MEGTRSRRFAELHMNLLSRRVSADLPSRPYHSSSRMTTAPVENWESGSSLLGREFRPGPGSRELVRIATQCGRAHLAERSIRDRQVVHRSGAHAALTQWGAFRSR